MDIMTKDEIEQRLKEIKEERELIEMKKKLDIEENKLKDEKSTLRKLIKRLRPF
jgi:hypothetical protein